MTGRPNVQNVAITKLISIKWLHCDAGFILFVCREEFFVQELSETAKLETET